MKILNIKIYNGSEWIDYTLNESAIDSSKIQLDASKFEIGNVYMYNGSLMYDTAQDSIRTKRDTAYALKSGYYVCGSENIDLRIMRKNADESISYISNFDLSKVYIEEDGEYYFSIRYKDKRVPVLEDLVAEVAIVNATKVFISDFAGAKSFYPNYFNSANGKVGYMLGIATPHTGIIAREHRITLTNVLIFPFSVVLTARPGCQIALITWSGKEFIDTNIVADNGWKDTYTVPPNTYFTFTLSKLDGSNLTLGEELNMFEARVLGGTGDIYDLWTSIKDIEEVAKNNKEQVDTIADTKLDKQAPKGGNVCVYIIKADGAQDVSETTTTLGTIQATRIVRLMDNSVGSTEPPTYADGRIIQRDPTQPYQVANKHYVDDKLLDKLDKNGGASEYGTVYGVSETGEQIQINCANQPLAGRIPRFDVNNRIQTNTPENELECANKYYVDTVAGTKLDKKTAAGGNVCLYFVDPSGNGVLQTGSTPASCVSGNVPRFLGESSGSYEPAGGRLVQRDPTQPYQVANKQYVDNMVKTYYLHDIILHVSNSASGMVEYTIEMKILSKLNQPISWGDFIIFKFAVMSSKGIKWSSASQAQETKYNEYFNVDSAGTYTYSGWTWTTESHLMSIIDTVNEVI